MWAFKKTERTANGIDGAVWRTVYLYVLVDQRLYVMQETERVGMLIVDVLIMYLVNLTTAQIARHS